MKETHRQKDRYILLHNKDDTFLLMYDVFVSITGICQHAKQYKCCFLFSILLNPKIFKLELSRAISLNCCLAIPFSYKTLKKYVFFNWSLKQKQLIYYTSDLRQLGTFGILKRVKFVINQIFLQYLGCFETGWLLFTQFQPYFSLRRTYFLSET